MPLAQRVGWLNIEMPIDKNGRLRGRVEPFGIDQWMTLGRYDPNVFQPDSVQMISEPRGAVPNIRCMVWLDANTGETDEVRESSYEACAIGASKVERLIGVSQKNTFTSLVQTIAGNRITRRNYPGRGNKYPGSPFLLSKPSRLKDCFAPTDLSRAESYHRKNP